MSGAARTLFLGSGAFGVPILDALVESAEVEVIAVVSAPDRPAGRRAELTAVPVARRARGLGLPVLQPARIRSPEAVAGITALRPALGVLADYGQIVPPVLLELPDHGILNLHPSLLPRHRGATPIPATILAGDREAGVTIIRMDAGLDTGPIVAAEAWPLTGTETASSLEARGAAAGAALLQRILGPWLRGEIEPHPQDDAGATLSRLLGREDGRLDASRPAVELERRVRAFEPWPGTFLDTAIGRVAVSRATVGPGMPGDVPGAIVAAGAGIALATAAGRLVLEEVRPAGGRPMSGAEFARGRGRSLLSAGVSSGSVR